MLLPKRVKYRRVQRGRMTGKATRGNVVCQGQYIKSCVTASTMGPGVKINAQKQL